MTYYPQLKTTTAEMQALKNIAKHGHNSYIPIIQITKPRISKSDPIEALERHIERAMSAIHKKSSVIVGITNDESFQDANLNQCILDSSDDYIAWRTRLEWMKDKFDNQHIIPCVVGYPNGSIIDKYIGQIKKLSYTFNCIAIRIPALIDESFDTLGKLVDILGLKDLPEESYILFDFEYVQPSEFDIFKKTLENLDKAIGINELKSTCIPLFSSCPSSFPIRLKQTKLIKEIEMIEYKIIDFVKQTQHLEYGDYGYIHPKRQEGGGFWYPRIDYPTKNNNLCFYTRYYNKETLKENGKLRILTTLSNEEAYRELSKVIINSSFYREDTIESWGREQILQNVNDEKITGKSPHHYISIRSNMHMEQILSLKN